MRRPIRFCALGLCLAALAAAVRAEDLDDVLSADVQVQITHFRSATRELERLSGTPAADRYVRESFAPTEAQLRESLRRYQERYGERALRKFARKYQFEDVLRALSDP